MKNGRNTKGKIYKVNKLIKKMFKKEKEIKAIECEPSFYFELTFDGGTKEIFEFKSDKARTETLLRLNDAIQKNIRIEFSDINDNKIELLKPRSILFIKKGIRYETNENGYLRIKA